VTHLTDEQIRWFRQRRSGLVAPFGTPEDAAAALGGVQAQILSAAMLALWNRSATGAKSAEALGGRLFDERTLVRLWGQRHTLHLYASADWPIIHATFAQRRTWWERQAALGKDIDLAAHHQGVAQVGVLLKRHGTLSRKQLRASGLDLPPALLSPWGGVFAELVRIGVACLARWEGGEARYAHREHWLPGLAWTAPTAAEARAGLARRYFACYGPASLADFAYWLGLTGATTLRGSDAWREQLVPVAAETSGGRKLFVLAADLPSLLEAPPVPEKWPVRLLGRFDPLLLAHRDKDWVVPAKYYSRVWRPAGHIEGVVLDQGQAVATWRYDRIGTGKLSVRVYPFRARLPVRVSQAVRRQAWGVARFFGLKLSALTVHAAAPPARAARAPKAEPGC
jgi:hypothetical protein